ncbi:LytTR family transcriptional regulator [Flavobacterium akiainvivens]|uniref:LytTR family transcriptional regulator n=1 Tax=Flavobacterium akiainvivens TaxID=1202724 RepID=A0A0M8MC44_9FLAO|nr:LytTR family DNA-binding domain-containing protein [Flavobacterium akiainvivens]KOS05664.1 LytTR family transcriptional regulator [Flavobacterium akiainvivens]SFQ36272.1 two component transcriptional regulator, LytTR family [Flavobacterium akiainvivens]
MNIVIIEDEKPNADRLTRLIMALKPDAVIVEVLESIADSVAWLSANPMPGLVMMDVRLSDGLSFEIFSKVKITCPIIFTTAYDEYAVRAFKFNSIDYLLKPIEQDELAISFSKLNNTVEGDLSKKLESLLSFVSTKDYRSRFLLPYRDGFKTLLVSDVKYFYLEHKITRAKLHNGTEEVIALNMDELESQLDPKLFFRANRQYIIHIDAIDQIYNHFNSKLVVLIKNNPGLEIIVSREKAALLKSWIDY